MIKHALLLTCLGWITTALLIGAQDAPPPAATAPTTQPHAGSEPLLSGRGEGPDSPTTQPAPQNFASQTQPATQPEDTYALSFNNVPIMTVAQFLEKSLGKPVLPHEKVKNAKITIVSSEKRPLAVALQIISQSLRQNGVIIQEYPLHIELLPIEQTRAAERMVLGPEQPLSSVPDKARIIDKMFHVENYDVLKLKDVVVAMLPEYGFVVADPNTHTLIVTDSVSGLEQIEKVIARLDVPLANQTIKKIIKVKHGDASRIVALVRILVAGGLGKEAKDLFTAPGRSSSTGGGGGEGSGGGGKPRVPQIALIEASKSPIVLTAEVSRNWIIAVADAQTMAIIEKQIEELDQPEMVDEPFEIYPVERADISEVTQQIQQAIDAMPGTDIKETTRIIPFMQSRRLLVFGSERGRQFVHSLLQKLDIESSDYQQVREFVLKHADATNVVEKVEALFLNRSVRSTSPWGSSYRQEGTPVVRVTADVRRNSVTVVTDPMRMKRIEKMIVEEWDTPFEITEVQPHVYVLKYADPLRVKDLLEDMFTIKKSQTGPWWNPTMQESNPVGRLAGQFAFDAMVDSNMIIVTTKTQSNYQVIDQIIARLDVPQAAGLPRIIELKHANAEDLAEQLNALMAEAGTPSEIRRASRALSEIERDSTPAPNPNNNNNRNQPNQSNDQTPQGMMRFWWQNARPRLDEQESSNLIGMPRFVPVNRRNALMILAPEAYLQPLADLIEELDKPGMQVVIHAVIAEIQHDDATTLGLRLASDPSILSDPRLMDSSVGGNVGVNVNELFGGNTFALGSDTFARHILQGNLNVSYLIQLLQKKLNLRILFEPRLYTADNQEAQFFDGRDVPVQTNAQSSNEGTSVNRVFQYRPIGTRLRIRPHITRDGAVDLNINLELSREVTGENVFGNPIFDRRETTTNVILKDGQTVMLSGIIRREDFIEKRKIPGLGDIPLLGRAFRSTDQAQRNRELIAFITPRVVRSQPGDADQVTDRDRDLLHRVREAFEQSKDTVMQAQKEATEKAAETQEKNKEKEKKPETP